MLEVRDGLALAAEPDVRHAAPLVVLRIVRLPPDRLVVVPDRRRHGAPDHAQAGPGDVGVHEVGIDAHGAAEIFVGTLAGQPRPALLGVPEPAGDQPDGYVRLPANVERDRVLGIEFDGLVQSIDGGRPIAQSGVGAAVVEIRRGDLGLGKRQRKGVVQVPYGLLGPPQVEQNGCDVDVRHGEIVLQPYRLGEVGDGGFEVAPSAMGRAAVVVRLGKIGIQPDRLVVLVHRL